jgi:glycerol-3-phosphate acyltransferase PlsX
MRIAVDIMGGDYAPQEILEGVLLFLKESTSEILREHGIKLYLVGRKEAMAGYDFSHFSEFVELVDARGVFPMDVKPTRVLQISEDYSLSRAALLVKEGKADVMYSAGNTGAAVASALAFWWKIE